MISDVAQIAAAVILGCWLYWLTGRVQRMLDRQDAIHGASEQLLAAIPGKSAPRTDGAAQHPHRWWQRLVDLTAPTLDQAPPGGDREGDDVQPIPADARPAPHRTDTAESHQVVAGDLTRVLEAVDSYGRHAHGARP